MTAHRGEYGDYWIDLGTTNSLICVYQDDAVRLIPNIFGKTLTPSVVDEPSAAALTASRLGERKRGIFLYQISYDTLSSKEKASLLQYAEKCKRELSVLKEATCAFELRGEKKATLDNIRLAKLGQDLFDRMGDVIIRALNDSGRTMEDIDEVILAGGSSKMPAVSFFLQTAFGKQHHTAVSPDEIVAMGGGNLCGN